MLYIARDGVGNITAICDNQTTAENLQTLIDDNVDEVLSDGVAEDYVYTIVDKVGFQHIATSEAAVVEHITSTPDIEFKENSQFYGLPKDEAKAAIQAWLDDGHMVNELTEDLDGALVSEYRKNTIYSKASPLLEGRDIDTAYKEIFGQDYQKTADQMTASIIQCSSGKGSLSGIYWCQGEKSIDRTRSYSRQPRTIWMLMQMIFPT